MRYTIDFSLNGFDEVGQEHRLVVYQHNPLSQTHRQAADTLVKFAAKILNTTIRDIAASRIKIKSAWLFNGSGKRKRVSGKDILETLVKEGIVAVKGRADGRVQAKPNKPLGRHIGPVKR